MTIPAAPSTFRKRARGWWNQAFSNGVGAIEAAEWYTYELTWGDPESPDGRFVLRQCPRCSSLVQPGNEDHHEAWHRGGSVNR